MKKKMWETLLGIFVLLIVTLIIGIPVLQKIQFNKTINALTSIDPKTVTSFRIYPRVIHPIDTPVEFKPPDPIIEDFLQSVTDLHSYWSSPGTTASQDHAWSLEVATKRDMIQMSCYIPSEKGDIVLGSLGKFIKGGDGPYYGSFQSRKLFQWYQKYSHRWLEAGSKEQGAE